MNQVDIDIYKELFPDWKSHGCTQKNSIDVVYDVVEEVYEIQDKIYLKTNNNEYHGDKNTNIAVLRNGNISICNITEIVKNDKVFLFDNIQLVTNKES